MADMGNNPIHYGDLFHGDIETGIDALISKVAQVESTLVQMIKDVKKEASGLGEALSGTSSATKGDRDATAQYAAEIEKLSKANEQLTASLDKVTKDLDALRKKKNEDKGGNVSLSESYASLSELIYDTGVNVEELLKSDKQLNIAKKNGETANKALLGSYNQLYAQYNLIKNVLNAMSTEMRNNVDVGKKWENEALRIMDAMKQMQAATGKHTLEVGNYEEAFSKAMNGLQISTQQVLREMPTLANSLQQFFIAISNNVPIFVDNLKRVQKETGSWAMAIKGVLSSLFSWQTMLLVVLTVLPNLAKKIRENKKATEELVGEWDKFAEAIDKVNKIQGDNNVSAAKAVAELKTLYAISQDVNRSLESRNAAITQMQTQYPDYLGSISRESILTGEASDSYDRLSTALEKNAIARGYLDAIQKEAAVYAELQVQRANKEVERQEAVTYSINEASKALSNYAQSTSEFAGVEALSLIGKKSPEAIDKEIAKIDELAQKSQDTIRILTNLFNPEDLIGDGGKGGKGLDKAKDYYWEWLESIGRLIENEEDKAIELNNVKYMHSIDTLQKELDARKKNGTLAIEQEKYMTEIIANLEVERQKKRAEIIKQYTKKTWDAIAESYTGAEAINEVVEETDLSITARYNKILAENANNLIASREKLNTALESGTYKEAVAEGNAFKELTKQKLKLEEEYQEALLKMRFETGEITADQYAIELSKLQTTLAKNIAGLERRRKGKFNVWNLLLGETKEDGKGNVYKELSSESQAFVSAFESAMSSAFEYMDEWMDKRIEMAEIAVEAAQKEADAAKTAMDYEMEARANGYANNVELARKEYEEKLDLERKAIAEKERLEKIQEAIDSAQQFSSLVTATANLWAGYSKLPIVGQALAIAATAAMWGSFATAKVQAAQMTATKYGEGMSEYLDYGGSHASGKDIDFGADKNGRRRRVERGEMIGVINKRNVEKYGVSRITDIIQSLNKGTFENKYRTTAQTEAINQMIMRESILKSIGLNSSTSMVENLSRNIFEDKYGMAFSGLENEGADLSMVERGISKLIEQGETKVVATPYGRIEYKGNNKRIIRNS